ncbi:MAG: DMT family transporter [Alphaproteobacteria bacterium]|nr:DMT family transporter [Alphaproteobacteria bacterium]
MVKFQIGVVPAEISVAYRFAFAALFMFGWAVVRRLPLRFSPCDHLFIALQGATIFSTNFFLLYLAAAYLTTGLIAVVFSTASALTMLFNAALARRPPPSRVALGAALGTAGIAAVFWPELIDLSFGAGAGLGLILCVGGTSSFALGSLVSARNQAAGLSVRGSTAWAMAYGTAFLALFAWTRGESLAFDPAFPYVGSLLYLATFGSVVAFACYFALLGRIGAERAAYATVLFPIVALSISTVFEDYSWTLLAFGGVCLTLVGNVLVLSRAQGGR